MAITPNKLIYENLTDNQRKFFLSYIYNGVGSDSLPKPPPLIFAKAAEFHDFAAFRGGTEEDRLASEKEFFHKCHDAVREQPLLKRPFYYVISYIYYYILRKADRFTWEYYPAPAEDWKHFIAHFRKRYLGLHNNVMPEWLKGAENIV